MSERDPEARAREAALAAIDGRLLSYGVETRDALEMQADFLFLRALRRSCESLRNKGLLVMVALFVTGLGALLVAGVKQSLGGPE